MINPIDLSGRRLLVTGASSGIGRATAILLSRLGASLVLNGRNREQLEATHALLDPASHVISPGDLSLTHSIEGWLSELVNEHGPLDGMVHSAGIHAVRPVRFQGLDEVQEVMSLNVGAAIALAKGFRKRLAHSNHSSIVFLASVMGLVSQPGLAAYSASKGAILALTRSLALEFAEEGIRVNAVAPGQVRTELTTRQFASLTDEQIDSITKMHPLGLGSADDVAHPIAFLLSDAARWITGTTLVVDGGYMAH
jgi:NAD(P)-dependent dehydrogenase (short-subunit alcohol dehydrogenase family)